MNVSLQTTVACLFNSSSHNNHHTSPPPQTKGKIFDCVCVCFVWGWGMVGLEAIVKRAQYNTHNPPPPPPPPLILSHLTFTVPTFEPFLIMLSSVSFHLPVPHPSLLLTSHYTPIIPSHSINTHQPTFLLPHNVNQKGLQVPLQALLSELSPPPVH